MTSNSASLECLYVSHDGTGIKELKQLYTWHRFNNGSWMCDLKIASTGYYSDILKISL